MSKFFFFCFVFLILLVSGCGLVSSPAYVYRSAPIGTRIVSGLEFRGTASWYGIPFHGRTTANGETYNMNDYTCAHRTLPFGTLLLVTNLANEKTVTVRVTDRGPYISGRIIDLSRAAAVALGMLDTGTAQVSLKVVENE